MLYSSNVTGKNVICTAPLLLALTAMTKPQEPPAEVFFPPLKAFDTACQCRVYVSRWAFYKLMQSSFKSEVLKMYDIEDRSNLATLKLDRITKYNPFLGPEQKIKVMEEREKQRKEKEEEEAKAATEQAEIDKQNAENLSENTADNTVENTEQASNQDRGLGGVSNLINIDPKTIKDKSVGEITKKTRKIRMINKRHKIREFDFNERILAEIVQPKQQITSFQNNEENKNLIRNMINSYQNKRRLTLKPTEINIINKLSNRHRELTDSEKDELIKRGSEQCRSKAQRKLYFRFLTQIDNKRINRKLVSGILAMSERRLNDHLIKGFSRKIEYLTSNMVMLKNASDLRKIKRSAKLKDINRVIERLERQFSDFKGSMNHKLYLLRAMIEKNYGYHNMNDFMFEND